MIVKIRIIENYYDFPAMHRDNVKALHHLYQKLIEAKIPLLSHTEKAVYIAKEELDSYFAKNDTPVRDLFTSKAVCPVCGIMAPYDLVRDYRGNNDCVSSMITCKSCVGLSDMEYRRLRELDEAEKMRVVLSRITQMN